MSSPGAATPAPDAASLQQAALAYLARYAATKATLRRVLDKRIDRWARAQPDADAAAPVVAAAHSAVQTIVGKLEQAGVLSDTGFAETRARSLLRSGRSSRAIQGQLLAKGIAPDLARSVVGNDAATELAAALVLARRRRIGPFRTVEPDDPAAARRKAMGLFARAGFARAIAERALDMDTADAEARILALRSDQAIAD